MYVRNVKGEEVEKGELEQGEVGKVRKWKVVEVRDVKYVKG